jgi:hypothetical protein
MRRLLALVGLFAVACGAVTVQAQTLKLAYQQGNTRTFTIHVVMNETVNIGTVTEPVDVDMTGTETETVQSVESDGVADVTLAFTEIKGKVSAAGQTTTVIPTPSPIQAKLAPDGRTLSMNGVSFTGGSPFGSVGSSGPESAVFPDNAVKPGDTWTKTYDKGNPFGGGTVSVTAKSKYLRNEKVNGIQTAVVNTKSMVPLDITIDLSKYGQASGASMTALTNLGITGMSIQGTDTGDTTTWIDPKGHAVEKTSVKVTIDATFSFVLAANAKYPGPAGPFAIKGNETIDLVAK